MMEQWKKDLDRWLTTPPEEAWDMDKDIDAWGSSFMDQFEKDVKKVDEGAWYEWDVDVLVGMLDDYDLTELQREWAEDYIEENE